MHIFIAKIYIGTYKTFIILLASWALRTNIRSLKTFKRGFLVVSMLISSVGRAFGTYAVHSNGIGQTRRGAGPVTDSRKLGSALSTGLLSNGMLIKFRTRERFDQLRPVLAVPFLNFFPPFRRVLKTISGRRLTLFRISEHRENSIRILLISERLLLCLFTRIWRN